MARTTAARQPSKATRRGAEADRMAALRDLSILDTLPDEGIDRLTALAASLFGAPMATVSLIDQDRSWLKSHFGMAGGETPRALAFCDHAIRIGPNATMVVEDATSDDRFIDNPFVTGDPHIRFYAGATLTTSTGHNLGTLCVIDTAPRARPSDQDLERLSVLAHMVVNEIEYRRATRAIAEQRRLLELAESMSGIGHWRMNIADNQITWSDEVYRIHGVHRDSYDPNLDAALDFFSAHDKETIARFVKRAVSHQADYAFELPLIRADGRVRHVLCKAVCELDGKGATAAIVGVFQDVTEQVTQVAMIKRSEARYRVLADNASDIIAQFRPGGLITFITPQSRAVLGYEPEEVVGRGVMELIHPDDVEPVRAYYQALRLSSGSLPEPLQFRIRHKDGHWVWLEGHPKMFFDPATGEAVEMQDAVRDITKRKMLEFELERARQEAEAATAVKSEFLSNMSHELRTPLTSILGFASLLKSETTLSDQGKRAVERVNGSSHALLAIVNDVLDFSRLEAGQVEIDRRPVVLLETLGEALALLEPQAHAKTLQLDLTPVGELPRCVSMDSGRVRQILLNLIGNAVKFTDAGGVQLVARYDRARAMLRCEVIDTGPGIAADRMDRLFKRFSQVDGSTTRAFGGAGLGLAIVKGLIEAMGGDIGADSRVGEGSRFWFEIPCSVATELAPLATEAGAEATVLAGYRLLVVDDSLINRELVRLVLQPYGVEVSMAESAEAAFEQAQTQPFDLILMDPMISDPGAPPLAKLIRDGAGPNDGVPILAFTSDEATCPGFDGVVAQPIVPQDLVAALIHWVSWDGDQSAKEANHG